MIRTATAIWKGSGSEGEGTLTTRSKAFENHPYNFKARFESDDGLAGTNPEELIAAAHAGCFAMALSFQLQHAGFTAESISTKATLTGSKDDVGFKIDKIVLDLEASVPGIEQDKFDELAANAKTGCPISRVLNCEIVLNSTLN